MELLIEMRDIAGQKKNAKKRNNLTFNIEYKMCAKSNKDIITHIVTELSKGNDEPL